MKAFTKRICSLLPVVPVLFLLACGSAPDSNSQHPEPALPRSEPGAVALAYTITLGNGDVAGALELVSPIYREQLTTVFKAAGPSRVEMHDMAVGSVSEADGNALVILTGSLCSISPPATGANDATSGSMPCVSNSDPHTTNPAFHVRLVRNSDSKWEIAFLPSNSGTAPTRSR
jgi:hypothetical protein